MGRGTNLMAGVAPAEACKVFGKQGDALGAYRPDIELIWWFNYDTLKDISGAADAFGEEVWELMQRCSQVYVTSNLSERHNFECVVGDARVVIIFPDADIDEYMAVDRREDVVLLVGNERRRRTCRQIPRDCAGAAGDDLRAAHATEL